MTNLMLEQDAYDQFDGVPYAQDVEKLEETVVKKGQLLWHPVGVNVIKKFKHQTG